MTVELLAIAAYVAVQIVIGFVVSRRIRTEADYLVAGRRLGPVMVAMSTFATWFGAETCVSAAAASYEAGRLVPAAEPFGYGLAVALMGLLLAAPLWRRGIVTLADAYRDRFGVGVERFAALLLVPGSTLWAAAQIRAFGGVLASASELTLPAAMTAAAIAVVLYTTVGGMLADAWHDLLQGVLIIVGLFVLLGLVLSTEPSSVEASDARAAPASVGHAHEAESLLATLDGWAIPILGSLVAQELVARVLSARSAKVARNATVSGGLLYVGIGVVPLLLGVLAARAGLVAESSETVVADLARHHLPTIAYALFVGALVAAILSTVDSSLLVAGSLLAHNVGPALFGPRDDAFRLRLARRVVLGLGVVAWGLAMGSESIADLVEQASAFGSAGVLVITLFGLFSRLGHAPSAIGALVAGAAGWLAFQYLVPLDAPYLGSVLAALLVYVALSRLGRRAGRDRATADLEAGGVGPAATHG
ncbi:MAG: sodium:solute symporter [Myxococcota bacterium]|nr:sodium:solute symporter [Myxococcota bacterium]MDW8362410.1 hypothetical protein [Myxococcales bacterium]